MYIETSYPRRAGDNAKLELRNRKFNGNMCLRFYYHMFGRGVNALKVFVGSIKVFEKTGSQGFAWKKATVNIAVTGVSTVSGLYSIVESL